MSIAYRKELRLLLPTFVLGMLAALSVWLVPEERRMTDFWGALRMALPFVLCPAMLVMLALDSFGREVSTGTFSLLLAQPVSRSGLWRRKILLLAGAMLLIWALWLAGLLIKGQLNGAIMSRSDWRGLEIASLLFLFVVFSGGLWTVLLFRQVGIAFWATILTPMFIYLPLVLKFSGELSAARLNTILVVAFLCYGTAGLLFARWLFMHAQDLQWSGGVISLPAIPGLWTRGDQAGTRRKFRPRRALLMHELQLHQSQFIVAGCLAVLHLLAVAARNLGGGLKNHRIIDATAHIIWILWLLMPLLVGCAAVAEERKSGTLTGQLCLPATRRSQFFIKLGVVLFLSVLFGAVMPALLESLDGSKLPAADALTHDLLPDIRPIFISYAVTFVPLALLSGLVSFYFSSLARNTLQALGPAVLGVILIVPLPGLFISYELWRELLDFIIGIPIVVAVLIWLAYRNYSTLQSGWRVWSFNGLALASAIAITSVSTTALYYRAWEYLLPSEPAHGPARISPSSPMTLQNEIGSLAVHIPDGRFWSGNFGFSLSGPGKVLISDWKLAELSGGSHFLPGSNWASVADCIFDTVGIRDDGSLWIYSKELPREFGRIYNEPTLSAGGGPRSSYSLTNYGSDHDWKEAVGYGRFALLLKQNGTLWTWSTNGPLMKKPWSALAAFQLQQVGSDSDWEEIRSLGVIRRCYARKKDGRVWAVLDDIMQSVNQKEDIRLFDRSLLRAPFLDRHDWRGLARVSDPARQNANRFMLAVRNDGTLRIVARFSTVNTAGGTDVRLGHEADWTSVCEFRTGAAALKADGSLWQWSFPVEDAPSAAKAERFSSHSDWRAISTEGTDLLALSADGKIWTWRTNPPFVEVVKEFHVPPLIGVSRRPQLVANIFSTDNQSAEPR